VGRNLKRGGNCKEDKKKKKKHVSSDVAGRKAWTWVVLSEYGKMGAKTGGGATLRGHGGVIEKARWFREHWESSA